MTTGPTLTEGVHTTTGPALTEGVRMTTDAALVRCECGYDVRGLPADGRCPECGRAVADATDGSAAVRQWRRRVRIGGGLVGLGWAVWAGWVVVHFYPAFGYPGEPDPPLLLAIDGSRVISACLVGYLGLPNDAGWAFLASRILVAAGLLVMAVVPRRLKTWPRVLATWLLAVAVFADVFVTLAWSSIAFALGRTPWFATWSGRYLADVGRMAIVVRASSPYVEAAVWSAVGLYLGVVASAAGRRGFGRRAAAVAIVSGLVVLPVPDTLYFLTIDMGVFYLDIIRSAVIVAVYVLVVRFGWLSFWSAGRWGRRPTVAA